MAKPPKQKTPKVRNGNATDSITDPRFSHIQTDPRYRLPSRKQTHVKLDSRFSRMLRDDDFAKKAAVDRYGRKLTGEAGRKELQRFYDFDEEKENGSKRDIEEGRVNIDDDEVDEDEAVMKELQNADRNYDPARDGGFSTSEDDSSEEESEQEVDVEEEVFGFPDQQTNEGIDVPMGDVTSRIAVVNLDWDNIRAVDLMAVLSSFCPISGQILDISVYPSEFGKERMEREEIEGPPKEIFAANKKPEEEQSRESSDESIEAEGDEEEEEDEKIKKSLLQPDNGEEFNSAKLRRYQLERLRYYYAIITLSSSSTAKALYDATDGTEYLTTANFFDLRFVPDDTDFSTDRSRDSCSKIPDGYRPNTFVTDALQHSKVRLTWDADDAARKESVKRAFTGSRQAIDENDLKAYLGSDSSDDSEKGYFKGNEEAADSEPKLSKKEASRLRLRSALGLSDRATPRTLAVPVGDMEITFTSGLSSKENNGSVFMNKPILEETTVEKYVRKEKERKQRRKERAKTTRDGEEVSDSKNTELTTEHVEDLGFDDPFFTSTDVTTLPPKHSEEDRKAARAARKADEEAAASERAELELLMDDDVGASVPGSKHAHFNINSVLKAEKAEKGKKKKKRFGNKDKNIGLDKDAVQDGFEMNVGDPRFSGLFENHEFAIDPTNPRFKGTKGMVALLEEGRKKRKREAHEIDEGPRPKLRAAS